MSILRHIIKAGVCLMEKETTGTIISVTKQWWLKINSKPLRTNALDGAEFPYIVKVQYTVDGKTYIRRKWINAGNIVPDKGSSVRVFYFDDKPSKARIEI